MSTTSGTTTHTTTPPVTTTPTTPSTTIPIPTTTIVITTYTPTFTTPSTTGPIPTAPIPQMSGATQQIVFQPKPEKLTKFNGITKDIRVQTWLKLFEVHTIACSDLQRVQNLMYYLSDTALEWYGDEIASNIGNPQYNWDFVQQKMVRRFGTSTAQPLIEVKNMSLRRDQTLEDYYRAKIRLLNQTSLSEAEKIQFLTDGLPYTWKCSLAPIPITTTDVWFESAQRVEAFQSKPVYHKDNQFKNKDIQFKQFKPQQNHSLALNTPNNSPPYPCRYCQYYGREELHWHSECPLKAKYRNQSYGNSFSNGNNRNNTSVKTLEPSNTQQPPDSSDDSSQEDTNAGNSFAQTVGEHSPMANNIRQNPYPSLDVKLNGKPITAIIDTGISIATEKIFRSLNTQLIPKSTIQITQLCGQTQTIGCTKAKLQIEDITKEISLHIIPNFKYPLLLGLDVGKHFDLSIDLKTCKVSTKLSPSANEYSEPQQQSPPQPRTAQLQTPRPQPPQRQTPQPQTQSQTKAQPKAPPPKQQPRKLPPVIQQQSLQVTAIKDRSGPSKSQFDPGISMRVSRSDGQHKYRNSFGKFKPNSANRYSSLNRWLKDITPDPQPNHRKPSLKRFFHTNHRKRAFVHPNKTFKSGEMW